MTAIVIKYENVDVTAGVQFDRTMFTAVADGNIGTATVVFDDSKHIYGSAFRAGGTLELFIDGQREWDGWVFNVLHGWPFDADDTANPSDTPRTITITAQDRNLLFTKRFMYRVDDPGSNIGLKIWPTETPDRTAILHALNNYVDFTGDGLDISSHIAQISSPGPYEEFTLGNVSAPMVSIFAECAQITGGVYWIGPDRAIHYADDRTVTAPFVLSDTPSGAQVGYREFDAGLDFTSPANEAIVLGAGMGRSKPVGYKHTADASVSTYGLWQWGEIWEGAYKVNTVKKRARSYVVGSPSHRRGHDDPVPVVSCTIFEPGIRVGQVVDFRSDIYGYQEDLPVRQMNMTFPTNNAVRYDLELTTKIDVPYSAPDRYKFRYQDYETHEPKPPPPIGSPPPIDPTVTTADTLIDHYDIGSTAIMSTNSGRSTTYAPYPIIPNDNPLAPGDVIGGYFLGFTYGEEGWYGDAPLIGGGTETTILRYQVYPFDYDSGFGASTYSWTLIVFAYVIVGNETWLSYDPLEVHMGSFDNGGIEGYAGEISSWTTFHVKGADGLPTATTIRHSLTVTDAGALVDGGTADPSSDSNTYLALVGAAYHYETAAEYDAWTYDIDFESAPVDEVTSGDLGYELLEHQLQSGPLDNPAVGLSAASSEDDIALANYATTIGQYDYWSLNLAFATSMTGPPLELPGPEVTGSDYLGGNVYDVYDAFATTVVGSDFTYTYTADTNYGGFYLWDYWQSYVSPTQKEAVEPPVGGDPDTNYPASAFSTPNVHKFKFGFTSDGPGGINVLTSFFEASDGTYSNKQVAFFGIYRNDGEEGETYTELYSDAWFENEEAEWAAGYDGSALVSGHEYYVLFDFSTEGRVRLKYWDVNDEEPAWLYDLASSPFEMGPTDDNVDYQDFDFQVGLDLEGDVFTMDAWWIIGEGIAPSGSSHIHDTPRFLYADGITAVYAVSSAYIPQSLVVYLEGMLLFPGVDYVEMDPDAGTFRMLGNSTDLSTSLACEYDFAYLVPGVHIYRPAPVMMEGWSTADDGKNAVMACSVMALDRQTLGAYTPFEGTPISTPPSHRSYGGGSGSLANAVVAWPTWGQTLNVDYSASWLDVRTLLQEKRGVMLMIDYSKMTPSKQFGTTTQPHCLYINEMLNDESFWGVDPLYAFPVIYTEDELLLASIGYAFPGQVTIGYTGVTEDV